MVVFGFIRLVPIHRLSMSLSPPPPPLVGDGIHTAVKSMESQSKRVSKVRTKRRKFRKRRTQWFVQDRVKYVLSSFLLDVFSFY